MGLTPDEFYGMSLKDYSRAADGYWLRHIRHMQGVRRLAYYIVRMGVDPKHARKIREQDLFALATDVTPVAAKPVRLSQEEFKAVVERHIKIFNKNKNG
jgi:hypothetical protein